MWLTVMIMTELDDFEVGHVDLMIAMFKSQMLMTVIMKSLILMTQILMRGIMVEDIRTVILMTVM